MITLINYSIKYSKYLLTLWVCIIIYGCLLPSKDIPEIDIVNIDKVVHLLFYIGFAYFLRGATYKKVNEVYTLCVAVVFGIGIELIQGTSLFNRSSSIADVAANTTGAIIGIIIFKILFSKSSISKS
ncbi:VanZ family protein [Halosquirtibacter laminarini]|uniref:VanZ family protein n=1 Tax=Halosquirtibacter laminarini TaxID=3374600 RepID=A0AC61NMR6_9BACT|nr:VanZ family protein [Prolixibacteraceae bacterium]